MFVRSPIEHLQSYYSQITMNGDRKLSISEFVFEITSSVRYKGLHQGDLFSLYADVFGRSSVTLISYEGVTENHFDPFTAIMHSVLNLHDFEPRISAKLNVGVTALEASILVLFTDFALFQYSSEIPPSCFRSQFHKLTDKLPEACTDISQLPISRDWLQFVASANDSILFYVQSQLQSSYHICDVDRAEVRKHWFEWSTVIKKGVNLMMSLCNGI
ncbi:hypothetical protein DUNSADRAFT_16856 [Dunaliella salina]|uniref:Encoded protein n=1 Tax=Dunaliella salina TaxID=3046 RepID=A0ABQ7G2Q9_DUNSA|nr:hypothetical protein DUNSADRAFT_16856 [Dunaliella salina]|eukprot:KAF5828891.1 hypothetical protein DUNSADRAFT_16856 [Dunaliella salina]